MKKFEADLQSSQKNASKATRVIAHLHELHMKDAASFSIWKGCFEMKITKLKRNASDKSWALMAKIIFLEVDLKEAREKNCFLEESSSWSTNKVRYD